MDSKKLDIKSLREKFGMSQGDLAMRLGVSRPTIVSIERGKRSLKIHEMEKVKQIFDLVKDFESDSDVRIEIPQKKLEKFKQVFLYILEKVGSKPNVGLTVLYKLLYFIDFDYYEKYEEQLMGLTYIKNHHGPTPKEFIKVIEEMKKNEEIEEVNSKYFKFDQRKYLPLPKAKINLALLSAQELGMIESVLSRLADKSATELSEYSHKDVPWASHEDGEEINYESVFYRNDPYSVREYEDEI